MGYDYDKWSKRFLNRSDITATLTHLTREQLQDDGSILSSVDVLLKILNDKQIIGSDVRGYIRGGHTAVCFQDAPIYGIGQNILHEKEFREELGGKTRYSSDGLIFLKRNVFKKGGRPVFYEKPEIAEGILPKEEWWRIVSYNLDDKENIIDWSHEREWRVKGNFDFDLKSVYVLLGTSKSYKEFMDKAGKHILENIAGITAITPIVK
ncbi:hypothetical protein [Ruminiclostridium josui]|uniref:hypothetical protein n=1 Tax=Ruminiclostridium josui TaxID=1499 RepID=UPI0004669A7D|nr:hypothetical protein [Ruminiclostridium josui]